MEGLDRVRESEGVAVALALTFQHEHELHVDLGYAARIPFPIRTTLSNCVLTSFL